MPASPARLWVGRKTGDGPCSAGGAYGGLPQKAGGEELRLYWEAALALLSTVDLKMQNSCYLGEVISKQKLSNAD